MQTESHFPAHLRAPELEIECSIEGMRGYMFEGPNGSQIVFWECEREAVVEPHSHAYDEYCVVVEGNCEEFVDGKAIRLKQGDELHIPAGRVHYATIKPPYRSVDFFGGPRFVYKRK